MRSLLLQPALALTVVVLAADLPRYAPEEGSTLVKTIETTAELTSTEIVVSFNGEEHSGEEIGDPEMKFVAGSKYVVTDEYVKMGKGKPKELKRTYDELASHNQMSQSAGGEENEGEKREQESDLAGKTVVFKWDDKKSEFACSFADDKGDAELLTDLVEDLDFRAFLPADGTAEDASWDLEASTANIFLFPGGDLKLQTPDDEDDDKGEVDRELRDSVNGKVTATYKGIRDEDKTKVAVIELKIDVKSKGDFESEENGTRAFDVATEMTGTILWDVATNHVHSVSMEGKDTTTFTLTRTFEAQGEEMKLEQRFTLSGPTTFKLTTGK